jgi:predicted RNA-binding Zn ribbon-like protein
MPMTRVPTVSLPWLVELVNEYAPQPRAAAAEGDDPYPDLSVRPDAPALPRLGTRDLVEVAERLWPVFAAAKRRDGPRRLNTLLAACALSPRLDESGEPCWATKQRDGRALVLAGCTASLLRAVERYGWERLGICAGADCADVYIDLTGRGSRRYCSHGCLNRARVRAYRSRERARTQDA